MKLETSLVGRRLAVPSRPPPSPPLSSPPGLVSRPFRPHPFHLCLETFHIYLQYFSDVHHTSSVKLTAEKPCLIVEVVCVFAQHEVSSDVETSANDVHFPVVANDYVAFDWLALFS